MHKIITNTLFLLSPKSEDMKRALIITKNSKIVIITQKKRYIDLAKSMFLENMIANEFHIINTKINTINTFML